MKNNSKNEIVYGVRAVLEAISANKEIEKVYLKKGMGSELFRQLFQEIRKRDIPFQYVPVERLNRFTGKAHQGVVAFISPVEYQDLEKVVPGLFDQGKSPLVLVLDSVTDIRNFGSIARSAECAGVDAIVVPLKNSAAINADAVKTSAGALHQIPICRVPNLEKSLMFLRNSGLTITAATEKANQLHTSIDFSIPAVIVLGSEDTGISPGILKMADNLVKIPIMGNIQSLNVSVAAGIILYEAVRQRLNE